MKAAGWRGAAEGALGPLGALDLRQDFFVDCEDDDDHAGARFGAAAGPSGDFDGFRATIGALLQRSQQEGGTCACSAQAGL
jgi:hypothetical protein